MKLKHTFLTPLLVISGAMLLDTPAQAQTQTAYAADDLFLGFRATGGTTDYLVNIGQASTYRDFGGTSFTLSLGNIQQDLINTFGAGWATRSDLFWSISGTPGNFAAVGADPLKTLYATKEESTFGTMSDLWQKGSSTAQGLVGTKMGGLATAYAPLSPGANFSTANSPYGLLQDVNSANSYASYMPGGTTANSGTAPGTSYNYFNPTIEGSFANGAAGSQLDLVRLQTGSGAGDFIGTFTIDSNANVSFNNNVVAPEPSSFAIAAAGAGLLGLLRRRRNA